MGVLNLPVKIDFFSLNLRFFIKMSSNKTKPDVVIFFCSNDRGTISMPTKGGC